MDLIPRYAKAVTALVGAVVAAVTAALADGSFSGLDFLSVAMAVATALGVGAVRNRTGLQRVKSSVHDVVE